MKKVLAVTVLSILALTSVAQAKCSHVRKYLNEPHQPKLPQQQYQYQYPMAAAAKLDYNEEYVIVPKNAQQNTYTSKKYVKKK